MLVSLDQIARRARLEGYAVPCFDTPTVETVLGAIQAAEALDAPVIIAHCPRFPCDVEVYGAFLAAAGRASSVPVCAHLDHAVGMEEIAKGVRGGYSSVMIDASSEPYARNVALTGQVAQLCGPLGVSVEAELGHVPDFDEIDRYDDYGYTNPGAVRDFVGCTGVRFLAVAVGTIHGPNRIEARIRYDLLKEIRQALGDDCALVIHGSSGLSDRDYLRLRDCGAVKFNIFTDYAEAALKFWRGYEPPRLPGYVEAVRGAAQVVRARCEKYLRLLGCEGKNWLR